jgi:hypothetical protein
MAHVEITNAPIGALVTTINSSGGRAAAAGTENIV